MARDPNKDSADSLHLARRCLCEVASFHVEGLADEGELLEAVTAAIMHGRLIERRQRQGVHCCRVCGCTEYQACEGGCAWAEPDLCTACVPFAPPAAAEAA